ncbi:hypothetical protein BJ912DRAFT_980282 [Pholiota molesta]|nr:hypothetical protein BJ912DRAFT_980282 [Pholiota molesta]
MDKDIGNFTEPVLRVCPVPRHVVGFIGGNHGARPRDHVEVQHHDYEAEYDPSDPYSEWRVFQKSLKTFGHYLEIIQMHLDEIQFGATNWAYLLPNKRFGGFYIDNGRKPKRTQLDRAMRAYRVLEGMDLTYEVYGHLLRGDGTVIGLVTEAAKGRMIKLSDRQLIYSAICTIQRRGCLYRGCGTNRFMISPEGKVRLLELFSLIPYSREHLRELEKDAELWHWEELAELFEEFKTHGRYGDWPERPLGGLFLYPSPNFFITYHIPLWEGFELVPWADSERVNSRQTRRRTITSDSASSSITEISSGSDVEDRPLNALEISLYRSSRGTQRAARIIFHPYRTTGNRDNTLMIGYDNTGSSRSRHVNRN